MPSRPARISKRTLSLILLGLVGCSSERPAPVVQPTPNPNKSATAELLTGLAEQLGSLREQLEAARANQAAQASAKPSASSSGSPAPGLSPTPRPGVAVHPCRQAGADLDTDGLPDSCEEQLAETYAPVIFHSSSEEYFPTSVEKFLPQTSLWFQDRDCSPTLSVRVLSAPSQQQLIAQSYQPSCKTRLAAASNRTRSKEKRRTFYLADLPESGREGSKNSQDWPTYVHVYPNSLNGATIQYWRLYAYSDAKNSRSGDWQGLHIVLGSDFKPLRLGVLRPAEIKYASWAQLETEGSDKNHPRIFVESESHEMYFKGSEVSASGCKGIGGFFSCKLDPAKPETHIRQETWKNGKVSWFSGESGTSAGLINLGQKTAPLNGQVFIQYAGLWGEDGGWGPGYHESTLQTNGFINAWAAGMLNPKREEAYPLEVSP